MPATMAGGVAKSRKPTKNEQRRAKKKLQKQEVRAAKASEHEEEEDFFDAVEYNFDEHNVDATTQVTTNDASTKETANPKEADTDHPLKPLEPPANDPIQDVPATLEDYDIQDADVDADLPVDNPLYQQYANIFERFGTGGEGGAGGGENGGVFFDDDDMIQGEDEEEATQKKLNKKQRKNKNKLTVAQLKALVDKPERVEWTDTSAPDPKFLINIKSMSNVVPVPPHWSLKREYLSSKRGVEKAAFKLPKFIADTGVSAARDAVLEKQANATLKQRQRERVQGKTGKVDLNFQKLYDAFFRLQTKPQFSAFGDVYFEGKEQEKNYDYIKPGQLSDDLQAALNIPPGAPPPWLVTMQKIGPPPSYPALKIPGLNAPIPANAQWGFTPGAYGKPPLDEKGEPLYGGNLLDMQQDSQAHRGDFDDFAVERRLWGQLADHQEEEEEEEEEDSDDEEDQDEDEEEDPGHETPAPGVGIQSYGAQPISSNSRPEIEQYSGPPRAAGQVLEQQSARVEGFFGGDHTYKVPTVPKMPVIGAQDNKKRKAGDMDVSMDVDALERDGRMSKEDMQKAYEAENAKSGGNVPGSENWGTEDLTAMIAEESSKRQKRDQAKDKKKR